MALTALNPDYKHIPINNKLHEYTLKFKIKRINDMLKNFDVYLSTNIHKINPKFDLTFQQCQVVLQPDETSKNTDKIESNQHLVSRSVLKGNSGLRHRHQNIKELTLGMDCEFVRKYVEVKDPLKSTCSKVYQDENNLLLTQFWIHELDIGFIFHHKNNFRSSLEYFYEYILIFITQYGYKLSSKLVINTVWHFGAAEYSHLSNHYKGKINKDIKVIRKMPVTMENSTLRLKVIEPNNRNRLKVSHRIRDTYLLYNESLEKIGRLINVPKIYVTQDDISDYDKFLKTKPKQAFDYAINDSYVTAEAYVRFKEFVANDFMLKSTSDKPKRVDVNRIVSLSQLGIIFLKDMCSKQEIKYMGHEIEDSLARDFTGKKIKLKVRNAYLAGCEPSYKGGLNACYHTGMFDNSLACDYDLKGAYPLAMTSILLPHFGMAKNIECDKNRQYDGIVTKDDLHKLGIVNIDYVLKDNYFYVISNRTDKGLILPKSDIKAVLTCVEFFYCLLNDMFESYVINNGYYFDEGDKSQSLIKAVETINGYRKEAQRKFKENPNNLEYELYDKFYKLIANSLYGKFAQGINSSTPKSAITNPAIAGYITACVRICMVEQANYLKSKQYEVYTITTDGFTLDRPISDDDMEQILQLPMTKYLKDNQKLYAPQLYDKEVLSLKHQQVTAGQYYAFRTRGYMMVGGNTDPDKLILAKNSIKTPIEIKGDKVKESEYVLDCIFNDYGRNIQENFNDKIDIYNKFQDLVKIREEVYINVCPDFKNRMIFRKFDESLKMAYWDAIPYESMEECTRHTKYLEDFKGMIRKRYKNHKDAHMRNIDKWFLLLDYEMIKEFNFYVDLMDLNRDYNYDRINPIKKWLVVKLNNKKKKDIDKDIDIDMDKDIDKGLKTKEIADLLDEDVARISNLRKNLNRGHTKEYNYTLTKDFLEKHKEFITEPIFNLAVNQLL